ncbi:hypothetical protein L9F63_008268 [Diploptera punctata]|uniref:L-Fucosyltransferase n=1 Tax=Diploptera punctata TaxID=6984 RepID=A0AAD8E2X9_DIPPU|nr:hypothetical protein L9F63_008268 [Diploptera punctata]
MIEKSLCLSEHKDIEIPEKWKHKCPDKPVITVGQGGRLGNQIWEYASVWAVAKGTSREPFVPSCIIDRLNYIFKNFTKIPPLKYIENCKIEYKTLSNVTEIEEATGSIVLKKWIQIPKYVVLYKKEILELFQFQDHITEKSQDILRKVSAGAIDPVFVAVHVRRTDYKIYLKRKMNMSLVTEAFFIKHMNYIRNKYLKVLFIVLSDDPSWCEKKLKASDTFVLKGNSPEQDLSIMANCNHTLFDYGTYGTWGALLAGGDTYLYTVAYNTEMASLLPNWHLVT